MSTWLYIVGSLAIGLFAFVLLFGAPYLPTLKARQDDALQLLNLKPGQLLLELGSGDGRMLKRAAEQGIKSIGYELNPLLVAYSRIATYRYRSLVTIKMANFWSVQLPQADGIYVFLLDPFMVKLHNKITQEISSSVRVVSFAFEIPNKKHVTEKKGMFLYEYPSKK